jgi:hypothetical protein
MNQQKLIDALNQFINETKETIEKLKSLLIETIKREESKGVIKIGKTAASTTSIIGSSIFVYALASVPLTSGLSLIGLGSCLAFTANVCNLALDFSDKSFNFEELQEIFKKRENSLETINNLLFQVDDIVDEDSFVVIFSATDSKSNDYNNENKSTLSRIIQAAKYLYENGMSRYESWAFAIKYIQAGGTIIELEKFHGMLNCSKSIEDFTLKNGERFLTNVQQQSTIFNKLFPKVASKSALNTIKNGNIVLSSTLVIVDVYNIIKSWINEYPSVESIKECIKFLEEDIYRIQSMLDIFEIKEHLKPLNRDK